MKGCVLPRYVQHSFWAEISLTLMIDANERVGYHHDEHCAIFLERLFDADIQLANCGSARGNTGWQKSRGKSPLWLGASAWEGTDWVPLRGSSIPDTHTSSNRSGES